MAFSETLLFLLSKKLNLDKEKLQELAEKKIREYNGLIDEITALALIAKEYGLDITDLILKKRVTLSLVVPGMKDFEISLKVGDKIFEKEGKKVFYVYDDSGAAKLYLIGPASSTNLKKNDIIRVRVSYVREEDVLALYVLDPTGIRKEEDRDIIEVLSSIDVSKKKLVDTVGYIFEKNEIYYIFTFRGRIYKLSGESIIKDANKFYRVKGILEDNTIKASVIEKINEDDLIRKILMKIDRRTEK